MSTQSLRGEPFEYIFPVGCFEQIPNAQAIATAKAATPMPGINRICGRVFASTPMTTAAAAYVGVSVCSESAAKYYSILY